MNLQTFTEGFAAIEANPQNPNLVALHTQQRAAIAHAQSLGLPTTKHEEWKYTNLNRLLKLDFNFVIHTNISPEIVAQQAIAGLEGNVIVLVNGVWQPTLSTIVDAELEVLSFGEASQKPDFGQYFGKFTAVDKEVFTALNTASAQTAGVWIRVPRGKHIAQPIVLYYLQTAQDENVAIQPRNIWVMEENTQATLVEKFTTLGNLASFINGVTEIYVAENAQLAHTRIQNDTPQSYQIQLTEVSQARYSRYTNITTSFGGAIVRNNLHTRLNGEGIESNLFGLYMLTDKSLVDNHSIVDHLMPNSLSNELYKGILDGQSTGVFNGKIFVRKDAQKTNAYQQNRNVLLSDSASVNTKPQLEIWADDVKCSHGATTGKLDQTALFYLRARGIPEAAARALLVQAFAGEIIDKIEIEAVHTYLAQIIAARWE